MDTGFIAEYIPLYVEATKLTIGIGLIGIALSLIVGLVISMIQYFKVPVLRQISAVYIELSRNTPLLQKGHQIFPCRQSVFPESGFHQLPCMVLHAKRMIRKIHCDGSTQCLTIPEFQLFHAVGLRFFFADKLLYGDDFCDYDSVLVKGQLHLPLLIGNAHGSKPAGRERDLMRFCTGARRSPSRTAVDPRQSSFHVITSLRFEIYHIRYE